MTQGNVPPKMVLDYGIALYLVNDYSLSRTALSRLLTMPKTEARDRRTGRLAKLLIAAAEKNATEGESLYEALFEEENDFCEVEKLDYDRYWPTSFYEQVSKLKAKMCELLVKN